MTSPADSFVAVTGRLARLHWFAAMNSSIQSLVPLLLVGSLASLVSGADPLAGSRLAAVCAAVARSTVGLAAVVVLVSVAYSYARSRGTKDPLQAALVAVAVFGVLVPVGGGDPWLWVGHRGVVTAILVALLSTRALEYLLARHVTLRFPRQVPPFISESMAVVLPATLLVGLAATGAVLVSETNAGSVPELVRFVVQDPLMKVLLSLPGHIAVYCLAAGALYLGNHAGAFGYMLVPFAVIASLENLEALRAGEPLPHVITYSFTLMSLPGQAGCLLIPALMGSFVCRSSHYRLLARKAVWPATFGVGEVVLFGMPIMRNRLFLAPMLVSTAANSALIYWAITDGLVGRFNGVVAPFWTPPVLGSALTSTTPGRAALLSLVIIGLNVVIWLPSVLRADRRQVSTERATAETALQKGG